MFKGDPLGFFNISTCIQLQNIKKNEGGPFRDMKNFFEKKCHKAEKGESLIVPKNWKRDPSGLQWFCISC